MGLFSGLKRLIPSSREGNANVLWLYVRCGKCGTPLAVRVNLANELSADYENGGYTLHKEMMDSKCFSLMHARLHLDDQRKIVEQTIEGGEFITELEFKSMSQ